MTAHGPPQRVLQNERLCADIDQRLQHLENINGSFETNFRIQAKTKSGNNSARNWARNSSKAGSRDKAEYRFA